MKRNCKIPYATPQLTNMAKAQHASQTDNQPHITIHIHIQHTQIYCKYKYTNTEIEIPIHSVHDKII